MSYCGNLPSLGGTFEESVAIVREHIRGEHGCKACRKRVQQATAADVQRRLKKMDKGDRALFTFLLQYVGNHVSIDDNIHVLGTLTLRLDEDDALRREPTLRAQRKSNGATRPGNGGYHVAATTATNGK